MDFQLCDRAPFRLEASSKSMKPNVGIHMATLACFTQPSLITTVLSFTKVEKVSMIATPQVGVKVSSSIHEKGSKRVEKADGTWNLKSRTPMAETVPKANLGLYAPHSNTNTVLSNLYNETESDRPAATIPLLKPKVGSGTLKSAVVGTKRALSRRIQLNEWMGNADATGCRRGGGGWV